MNRVKGIPLFAAGALLAMAGLSPAAFIHTETFDNQAGWTASPGTFLTVSHNAGVGNPGGSLQGQFAAQIPPGSSQTDAFRAGAGASGGAFTGSYLDVGATGFRFSIFADTYAPSDLAIQFFGASSFFFSPLAPLAAGVWHTYTVSFDIGNWTGGNQAQLTAALNDVQWVEVQVTRGGVNAHSYYLDNFQLLDSPLENGGGSSAIPEPSYGLISLVVLIAIFRRQLARKNG